MLKLSLRRVGTGGAGACNCRAPVASRRQVEARQDGRGARRESGRSRRLAGWVRKRAGAAGWARELSGDRRAGSDGHQSLRGGREGSEVGWVREFCGAGATGWAPEFCGVGASVKLRWGRDPGGISAESPLRSACGAGWSGRGRIHARPARCSPCSAAAARSNTPA